MQLKTDNFCQIVLSDEAKIGNVSVAGNLVFESWGNGQVSIYQTSDNPETEKLLDAAQDSELSGRCYQATVEYAKRIVEILEESK